MECPQNRSRLLRLNLITDNVVFLTLLLLLLLLLLLSGAYSPGRNFGLPFSGFVDHTHTDTR
jgi:hypothetical protein